MNEIRAGVQEAVSGAIEEAYTSVLVNYNTMSEEEQTVYFRNTFFSELFAFSIDSTNLFDAAGTAYNPAALIAFVSEPAGAEIGGSGIVEYIGDETGSVFAVVLRYCRHIPGGRLRDLRRFRHQDTAPLLPYTSATSRQAAISDFAIVAGALLQQGGGRTVGVTATSTPGAWTSAGPEHVQRQQRALFCHGRARHGQRRRHDFQHQFVAVGRGYHTGRRRNNQYCRRRLYRRRPEPLRQ